MSSSTYSTFQADTRTETTQRTPFEPFTQSDLEVVTGNVQRPNGIVWFNNKLYTACTGDFTLYEIDAVTGSTLAYIGGVQNAHSLYAETSDTTALSLWLPDFATGQLLHVTRQGIQRIAEDIDGAWGIAALDAEHFVITSLLENTLLQVSRDGEITPLIDSLASPTGVVVQDDHIFVANNGSTRRSIEAYPVEGTLRAEPQILVRGLQNTTGLAMGSDGYLYFAYSLGTRGLVGRADPAYCLENGGCTAEDIDIVIYTELESPLAGLTLSDDMRLYIHTMFRPEIYWVQLPI
ncbi:MAG: hypothetical protein SF162_04835 [bacterium]|nr:hypothetical protein [bacterium]